MEEIASRKDATPSQIALGWLHAQGEDVFPVSCGARNLFLNFCGCWMPPNSSAANQNCLASMLPHARHDAAVR